jgi:hypothetical protein
MSTLTLQFPEKLLADAQALAEREHISLEEYVLRILAEQVSGDATWQRLTDQGRQVSRERFLEILRKAPNVPPIPGDEL